jgi:hypothetical protein
MLLDGNATPSSRKLEQRSTAAQYIECTLLLLASLPAHTALLAQAPGRTWHDWPCVGRERIRVGRTPAGRCKGEGHGKLCQAMLTGDWESEALGGFDARGTSRRLSLIREIGLVLLGEQRDLPCVLRGN